MLIKNLMAIFATSSSLSFTELLMMSVDNQHCPLADKEVKEGVKEGRAKRARDRGADSGYCTERSHSENTACCSKQSQHEPPTRSPFSCYLGERRGKERMGIPP